jgi:hypothetical protein
VKRLYALSLLVTGLTVGGKFKCGAASSVIFDPRVLVESSSCTSASSNQLVSHDNSLKRSLGAPDTFATAFETSVVLGPQEQTSSSETGSSSCTNSVKRSLGALDTSATAFETSVVLGPQEQTSSSETGFVAESSHVLGRQGTDDSQLHAIASSSAVGLCNTSLSHCGDSTVRSTLKGGTSTTPNDRPGVLFADERAPKKARRVQEREEPDTRLLLTSEVACTGQPVEVGTSRSSAPTPRENPARQRPAG